MKDGIICLLAAVGLVLLGFFVLTSPATPGVSPMVANSQMFGGVISLLVGAVLAVMGVYFIRHRTR